MSETSMRPAVPMEALVRRARQRAAEKTAPQARPEAVRELPLTAVQQGLWLNGELRDIGAQQLVTWSARLDGDLDVAALTAALRDVVARHPRLTARLRTGGEQPLLELSAGTADIAVIDPADAAGLTDQAAAALLAQRWPEVDPQAGRMFVATLIRAGAHRTYLGIAVHHLVFDGGSMGVIFTDLTERYRLRRGHGEVDPPGLPAVEPVPVVAETEAPGEAELAFWRTRLADAPPPLRAVTPGGPAAPDRTAFSLDAERTAALRALAQRCRATPFMLLVAGLAVAVRRCGGGPDVLLGALLDLRGPQHREQVSYHLNTVVLRAQLPEADGTNPTALVSWARAVTVAAMAHRGTPLSDVLATARGGGARDVVPPQITLDYLQRDTRGLALDDIHCEVLDQVGGEPEFGLGVIVGDIGEQLEVALEPGPQFLDQSGVDRFAAVLREVLEALAGDPDVSLDLAVTTPVFVPPPGSADASSDTSSDALSDTSSDTSAGPASAAGQPDPEVVETYVRHVTAAFTAVLKLPAEPDPQEDFFELGGQSLLAIRTAIAISRRVDRKVTIRDIFDHPTAAALGRWLAADAGQPAGSVSEPGR